jgi:hypothetical protein
VRLWILLVMPLVPWCIGPTATSHLRRYVPCAFCTFSLWSGFGVTRPPTNTMCRVTTTYNKYPLHKRPQPTAKYYVCKKRINISPGYIFVWLWSCDYGCIL